jgi:mannan endo-1,4-beta-mannosidase
MDRKTAEMSFEEGHFQNGKNMKIRIIIAVLFFGIFPLVKHSQAATPADPNALPVTKAVLDYLANLPNNGSSNRIIAGQHTYMTDNLIPSIYRDTGKYPGLIGIDYFYQNNSSTNNQAITWAHNNHALITVCHHWNNPNGGDAWNTSNVDFTQMVIAGTSLNSKFNSLLDQVAGGFQTLQNANPPVVVLYRPFHEMNGGWFWWGGKDPTQFKNVWIYMFNYLTGTKGLHNILWVYGPNGSIDTTYYPGSQYVDIVGADVYGSPSIGKLSGYDNLPSLNKPFGLTEWGPCPPDGCSSKQDISQLLSGIKGSMPKTVFWMNWAESFSLDYHLDGTKTLFADPWVITADEIPSFDGGGTTDTMPPAAPTGLRIN